MKKFKCLLNCGIVFLLISLLPVFGCSALKYEDFTIGYLNYRFYRDRPSEAMVVDLTQKGFEEANEIVIPPYADGKIVKSIGVTQYIGSSHLWSRIMESVYIPYTIDGVVRECIGHNSEKLSKIVVSSNKLMKHLEQKNGTLYFFSENVKYYITSLATNDEKIKYQMLNAWSNFNILPANVSFMFNYNGSPNDDYFYIDNFGYGEKIMTPPYCPVREGYEFGGWYKESECINKWDFKTDTLPQAQFDDEEQEIYQETKLYAKWIKI